MGDCIMARGIDTSVFMRNPTMLANHDPAFPLGRVSRLWVAPTPEGDALMFEAEVLPVGTSARIDERWAAIQAGAANGISIGFIGQEMEQREAANGRTGTLYRKSLLLEISSVALPACPSCLIEQRAVCPHGACACDEALDLDLEDDEIGDLEAQDVIAAVKMIVPQLAAQEVARLRGRIDDVIDLGGIDADAFDPLTSAHDRAELVAAVKIAVPALIRQEVNRLRGRID